MCLKDKFNCDEWCSTVPNRNASLLHNPTKMFTVYSVYSDYWGSWHRYCMLLRRNNVFLPNMINDWLKKVLQWFTYIHLFNTVKQVARIHRGGSTWDIHSELYCHISDTGRKTRHMEQRKKCRFNKRAVLHSLIMKGKVMARFQELQKSANIVYTGSESMEDWRTKC